jgi:hypothetical protein
MWHFSPGENTSCKVVDIVKQIGVEMKVADIKVSHRAGKCTPDRPDKLLPGFAITIRVITKLPNSEQSHKGKVKTHKYIKRQNQSTTGKL